MHHVKTDQAPKELTVAVWFGFGLAVADVQVTDQDGPGLPSVKIMRAALEPHCAGPHNPKIPLCAAHLDAVALMRRAGAVTLRDALEDRAREEVSA